ncbi:MAG: hypothetical protein M3Y72_03385 [Acidobacteriota bacterium]|nr:hypothetical protein [Acidobacteriota bacterium]
MNWAFWVELWVRSAILLAAAIALRQVTTRATPAFSHRLLLGSLLAMAALPLLSIALPVIPVSLWGSVRPLKGNVTVTEISAAAVGRGVATRAVNWPLFIWLAGALFSLAPLVAGAWFARRLAKRANAFDDSAWQSLLDELSSGVSGSHKPELLISDELLSPLTCGVARPRIVLPAEAREWGDRRRRVVLLHEMRTFGDATWPHSFACTW